MPKVWMALFFGYNGQNFQGMQFQKDEGVVSIEKLLIENLYKEGFLACKSYTELVKNYKFGRAARTDKGVHAVLNGVSCLFTIPESFYDEEKTLQREKLLIKFKTMFENTEITIHSFNKVSCRFDIRSFVKSRTYCYICPRSYFAKDGSTKEEIAKALEKVNDCCARFIGTHNFHNYSKNLKCKDPKARRYILEFSCIEIDDKWFKFVIKGQSFVYHQIRKIIGSILQVFMSEYEASFIDNTFFNNQFYVPLAPPFGLYLRTLTFESYNRKTDIPEKIDFDKCNESAEKVEKLINEHIYQIDQKSWDEWYELVKEGVVPKFEEDEEEGANDDD